MGLPLPGGGDGAAAGGTCLSVAVASGETVPPRSAPRTCHGEVTVVLFQLLEKCPVIYSVRCKQDMFLLAQALTYRY